MRNTGDDIFPHISHVLMFPHVNFTWVKYFSHVITYDFAHVKSCVPTYHGGSQPELQLDGLDQSIFVIVKMAKPKSRRKSNLESLVKFGGWIFIGVLPPT